MVDNKIHLHFRGLIMGLKFTSIFLMSLIFSVSVYANQVITYEKIIPLEGMSKSQIYDGARQWFAKEFKSANSVIQYENLEAGTIIGKGNVKYACVGMWDCAGNEGVRIQFTVKIDSKDEKVRIRFDDIMQDRPARKHTIYLPASVTPVIRGNGFAKNVENQIIEISDQIPLDIKNVKQQNEDW